VLEAGLDDLTVTSTVAAVQLISEAENHPSRALVSKYPAILATYLVAIGVHRYDGTFWSHISDYDLDREILKRGFLHALEALHLETFADLEEREGWHRFVGPILAHGGIPRHSLGDFFKVLLRDLRRFGSGSAEELVALWRTRHTGFENVDRPVRRFLLYGGGPAVDFLDRCIALARLSQDQALASGASGLGLPDHVVEAYGRAIGNTQPGLSRSATAVAVPRPRVRLDPWDRIGPVAELPEVPPHLRGSRWLVNNGNWTREIEASILDEMVVPLNPAPVWEIEFASDGIGRTFAFECLGTTPVVCFDPDGGAYLDEARPIAVDSVWLLTPAGAHLRAIDAAGNAGEPVLIDQLPSPMGSWHGFDILHVSLEDVAQLRVEIDSFGVAEGAVIRVGRSMDRPSIVDSPVPATWSADGLPVFPEAPYVRLPIIPGVDPDRWTISVTTSGERRSATGAELWSPEGLEIGRLLAAVGPVRLELHIRGPLGSDLRGSFMVVPGLRLERPTEVILPQSEHLVRVKVSASDVVSINGSAPGESVDVQVPVGAALAHVELSGGAEAIGLRIGVPKLVWALMHRSGLGVLSTQPVSVDRDDLESGDAQAILLSTGVSDTAVRVSIEADRRVLAETAWERTGGSEGRWSADLAPFRDSVRISPQARLDIALATPSGRCLVGYVVSQVVASEIMATLDESAGLLEIRFVEGRRLSRRVVRLWSRQRPWEPTREFPIPDDQEGSIRIASDSIVPGDYRVQIAVDDPWFSASRPRRGSDGTADLTIGSSEAVTRAHKALEFGTPTELLELAVVTGRVPKEMDDTDLPGLAVQALMAAAELLNEHAEGSESRALAVVTQILFADAGLAVQAIAKALRAESVDRKSVVEMSLAALPTIRAVQGVEDRDLRLVWQAAPSLGAFVDVPAAVDGVSEAQDRCAQFIGWRPGENPPSARPGLQRVYLGMPAGQLRTIRDIVGLVPQQAIANDTYALATFEWLLAVAADDKPIRKWWRRFGWLATDSLDPGMPNEYLAARKSENHPDFHWRDLPQAVLAAALHITARTQSAPEAIAALSGAFALAPRLVLHDLVLSRVLIVPPLGASLDSEDDD